MDRIEQYVDRAEIGKLRASHLLKRLEGRHTRRTICLIDSFDYRQHDTIENSQFTDWRVECDTGLVPSLEAGAAAVVRTAAVVLVSALDVTLTQMALASGSTGRPVFFWARRIYAHKRVCPVAVHAWHKRSKVFVTSPATSIQACFGLFASVELI